MFYGLCFLALYILFNAYMCFLSFFELHQLQLSCTAPRSTVCHSRVSSTSSSSCALSSLYKAPDARVAASSLVPAGDAALKKKIPVTALKTYLGSRAQNLISYILRSLNGLFGVSMHVQ